MTAIKTEPDRAKELTRMAKRKLPFESIIRALKNDRSAQLNAMLYSWYHAAARATGEDTPAGIRGFCKLHFGVPIMRAQDPQFNLDYTNAVIGLPYESKIKLMSVDGWFPVSSLMKTGPFIEYLKDIQSHYAEQGVQLLFPDEIPAEAYS